MVFTTDAASSLRPGESLRVREVTSDRSKGRMALLVAESELLTNAASDPITVPRLTAITVRDATESRSLMAQALPMLYVVLLGSIVPIAASRFQSGRSLRTLEMLLVRPLRRSELLGGLATSAITLGLVSGSVVLGPFTALALLVAAGDGAASVAAIAGALVILVLCLVAIFAAIGLAVGVSAKSLRGSAARTTMVTLALTAVALAVEVSGVVAKLRYLPWLPFTSALLLIRSSLASGPSLVGLTRVMGITALTCAACFAYARRFLDSERVTTRA
jgi:ABC-type Na+ efflux pump permease subunit